MDDALLSRVKCIRPKKILVLKLWPEQYLCLKQDDMLDQDAPSRIRVTETDVSGVHGESTGFCGLDHMVI